MFQNKLRAWVIDILNDDNITNHIIALNFGIFQTKSGYSLYCVGSKEYNVDDNDWACNEDFAPQKKYLIADQDPNELTWSKFANKTQLLLHEIIESNLTKLPPSIEFITCGFDDGDLSIVWNVNEN